jgi:YjbE family integral membrane protein
MLTMDEFYAFLQVVWIDLALAGDNAIVVGMAAAGLPKDLRIKAIFIGIAAAVVMRIGFALVTTQLLAIIGLLLAGGILLLWVAWKLYREIQRERHERRQAASAAGDGANGGNGGNGEEGPLEPFASKPKSFRDAVTQIVIADLSMSLDNVLAVAGAAREHAWVLIFGLVLSIALMAVAANYIARLLKQHHWIAYIGLLVILYVAGKMIWEGAHEVWVAVEEPAAIGEPATPATAPAPAPAPAPTP